ncbi:holo-ACP synthase [Streptomyces sp. NPDC020883]|uniref:holo-ACP synthase n=1 Tax=Streptomyces sp. NPDC020883 TaxID=3365099 RepID=UPI0037AD9C59
MRIGVDVLDRSELARLLKRPWFLRFCFSPQELEHAASMGGERRSEYLTGRFAAKEAVMKALGIGLLQGIPPHDIDVQRNNAGAPEVRFRGRAAQLATTRITLSIAHKQNVVMAVALASPRISEPPADTRPSPPT